MTKNSTYDKFFEKKINESREIRYNAAKKIYNAEQKFIVSYLRAYKNGKK